jgi:hypothetical protein
MPVRKTSLNAGAANSGPGGGGGGPGVPGLAAAAAASTASQLTSAQPGTVVASTGGSVIVANDGPSFTNVPSTGGGGGGLGPPVGGADFDEAGGGGGGEGSDDIWPNQPRPRSFLRFLALISLLSVILNTPKTFEHYPQLIWMTFVADVICVIVFTAEMIAKIRDRGLWKPKEVNHSTSSAFFIDN